MRSPTLAGCDSSPSRSRSHRSPRSASPRLRAVHSARLRPLHAHRHHGRPHARRDHRRDDTRGDPHDAWARRLRRPPRRHAFLQRLQRAMRSDAPRGGRHRACALRLFVDLHRRSLVRRHGSGGLVRRRDGRVHGVPRSALGREPAGPSAGDRPTRRAGTRGATAAAESHPRRATITSRTTADADAAFGHPTSPDGGRPERSPTSAHPPTKGRYSAFQKRSSTYARTDSGVVGRFGFCATPSAIAARITAPATRRDVSCRSLTGG
jgi:hypothetical protein